MSKIYRIHVHITSLRNAGSLNIHQFWAGIAFESSAVVSQCRILRWVSLWSVSICSSDANVMSRARRRQCETELYFQVACRTRSTNSAPHLNSTHQATNHIPQHAHN